MKLRYPTLVCLRHYRGRKYWCSTTAEKNTYHDSYKVAIVRAPVITDDIDAPLDTIISLITADNYLRLRALPKCYKACGTLHFE